MKKIYTAPNVQDLGTVRDLTLGAATGPNLDHSFPDNTPAASLTFS
jgi:hypothetical protein